MRTLDAIVDRRHQTVEATVRTRESKFDDKRISFDERLQVRDNLFLLFILLKSYCIQAI
jgi:hypothetical protein